MFDMKNLSDTLGGGGRGNSNLYMVDHENSTLIIAEYSVSLFCCYIFYFYYYYFYYCYCCKEAIESADNLVEVIRDKNIF